MQVLIFDPVISGHRFNYLRIITTALKNANHTAILLTLEAYKDAHKALELQKECEGYLKVEYLKLNKWQKNIYAGDKLYNKELINYLLVRNYLAQRKQYQNVDFIFFPYVDSLARLLSFIKNPFFGIKWSGISMVPSFHYVRMKVQVPPVKFIKLKAFIFINLLKNKYLSQLLTIDLPLEEYIGRYYPKLKHKIKYLPDPVEMHGKIDKDTARKNLGISPDSGVILLYGSISERKGVLELLKAAQHNNFPKHVKVIIAGVQTAEVKSKINSLPKNGNDQVIIINRFLTYEEEYALFKASDVVWCGYKNFYGMSAVLVHAAAMGRPVISSKEGVAAWLTERYQMGVAIDIKEEKEVIHAIEIIFNNGKAYQTYASNGMKMAKHHQAQYFSASIINALSDEA